VPSSPPANLSLGYVREAQASWTAANRVPVRLLRVAMGALPSDVASDRIWGQRDPASPRSFAGGREVQRVLHRTGCAVFCEPWGGNRWLNFARRALAYRHRKGNGAADEARSVPATLGQFAGRLSQAASALASSS